MNKRQYCESRESVAYYSGLNGLEIKGIEYGINDGLIQNTETGEFYVITTRNSNLFRIF